MSEVAALQAEIAELQTRVTQAEKELEDARRVYADLHAEVARRAAESDCIVAAIVASATQE